MLKKIHNINKESESQSALAPFLFVLAGLSSLLFSLLGHFDPVLFLNLSHGLLAGLQARLQLSLPLEGLFSQRHEGSFHVHVVLRRRLQKIRVDALAELFPLFPRNRPFRLQISLVRKHHKREALGSADHGFGEERLAPRGQIVEGPGVGDVVDEKGAIGPAIERCAEGLVALLTCRVPNLERDGLATDYHFLV